MNPADQSPDDVLGEYARDLARAAPDLLWHYTSAEGVLGILREGSLRATGLHYLNDTSEASYMPARIIARIKAALPAPDGRALESLMASLIDHQLIAVTCFCEDGDLLGQWRGYTGGSGFAIGFDSAALAERWVAERKEGVMANARYTLARADLLADEYAARIVAAWRNVVPDGVGSLDSLTQSQIVEDDVEALARRLPGFVSQVGHLVPSASFHKSEHFADEREWRLVTSLRRGSSTPHVAARGGGLTVFRPVRFQDSASSSPIRRIRIGPSLDYEQQRRSVELLLGGLGYSEVAVDRSSVPMR